MLQVPSEAKAKPIQERISRLFHDKLIHVLEAVFSDFFSGNEIVKIDRLILDLGSITEQNLERKVEEAIYEQLPLIISKLSFRQDQNMGQISARKSNFELLEYFLEKGTFPWWVRQTKEFDVDFLIQELLKNNPKLAKQFLQKKLKNPQTRQRLEFQLSEESLQAVRKVLTGAEAINYDWYLEQIELLHQHAKIRGTTKKNYRQFAENLLLGYLGQESKVEMSPEGFGLYFLEKLVQKFNISAEEINEYYHQKIPKRSAKKAEKNWLESIENWVEERQSSDGINLLSKVEIVVAFLESGIFPKGSGGLSKMEDLEFLIIELSEQKHSVWVARLKHLLSSEKVLRRIENQLNESAINAIHNVLYGERIFRIIEELKPKIFQLFQLSYFPPSLENRLVFFYQSSLTRYFQQYQEQEDFVQHFIQFFAVFLEKKVPLNWVTWWNKLLKKDREGITKSPILVRLFQVKERQQYFIGNLFRNSQESQSEFVFQLFNSLINKGLLKESELKFLQDKDLRKLKSKDPTVLRNLVRAIIQQPNFFQKIASKLSVIELANFVNILLEGKNSKITETIQLLTPFLVENPLPKMDINQKRSPAKFLWLTVLKMESEKNYHGFRGVNFWKNWVTVMAEILNISVQEIWKHFQLIPKEISQFLPGFEANENKKSEAKKIELAIIEKEQKIVFELEESFVLEELEVGSFWKKLAKKQSSFDRQDWQKMIQFFEQNERAIQTIFAKEIQNSTIKFSPEKFQNLPIRLLETVHQFFQPKDFEIQQKHLLEVIKFFQKNAHKLNYSPIEIERILKSSAIKFAQENPSFAFNSIDFLEQIIENFEIISKKEKGSIFKKLKEENDALGDNFKLPTNLKTLFDRKTKAENELGKDSKLPLNKEGSFFYFLKTGMFSKGLKFNNLIEMEVWLEEKIRTHSPHFKKKLQQTFSDKKQLNRAIQQFSKKGIKALNIILAGEEFKMLESCLEQFEIFLLKQNYPDALKRRLPETTQTGLLKFLAKNPNPPFVPNDLFTILVKHISTQFQLEVSEGDFLSKADFSKGNIQTPSDSETEDDLTLNEARENAFFHFIGNLKLPENPVFAEDKIEAVLLKISQNPSPNFLKNLKSKLKESAKKILPKIEQDFSDLGIKILNRLLNSSWVQQQNSIIEDYPKLMEGLLFLNKKTVDFERVLEISLLEMLVLSPVVDVEIWLDITVKKIAKEDANLQEKIKSEAVILINEGQKSFSKNAVLKWYFVNGNNKGKSKVGQDFGGRNTIFETVLKRFFEKRNQKSTQLESSQFKLTENDKIEFSREIFKIIEKKKIEKEAIFKSIIEVEESLENALKFFPETLIKTWQKRPLRATTSKDILELFSTETTDILVYKVLISLGKNAQFIYKEGIIFYENLERVDGFKSLKINVLKELVFERSFGDLTYADNDFSEQILRKAAILQRESLIEFLPKIASLIEEKTILKSASQRLEKELKIQISERDIQKKWTAEEQKLHIEAIQKQKLEGAFLFLQSGVFSQENQLKTPKEVEKIITEFLENQPATILKRLESLKGNPKVLERLEENFATKVLTKMIAVFEEARKTNLTEILTFWESISWNSIPSKNTLKSLPPKTNRSFALEVLVFPKTQISKPLQFFKKLVNGAAQLNHQSDEAFYLAVKKGLNTTQLNAKIVKLFGAYEQLFADKKMLELSQKLEKRLSQTPNIKDESGEIAILEHYFETREMAWWASPKKEQHLPEIMMTIAEKQPQNFRKLMRKNWKKQEVTRKVIQLFDTKKWLFIAEKLHGNYVMLVEASEKLLVKTISEFQLSNKKGKELDVVIWTPILDYLWSANTFSSETFVVKTIEKVAKSIKQDSKKWAPTLVENARKEAAAGKLAFLRLKDILEKWKATPYEIELVENKLDSEIEEEKQIASNKNQQKNQLLESLQNIRYYLEFGALRAKDAYPNKRAFLADFAEKLDQYPKLLRKILVHLMNKQEAILRLLSVFPNRQIGEIIRLLYAGKMDRILLYWRDLMSMLPGVVNRFDKKEMENFFHYQSLIFFPNAQSGLFKMEQFLSFLIVEISKKDGANAMAILFKIKERTAQNTSALKGDWEKMIPKLFKLLEDHLEKGQQKIRWEMESINEDLKDDALYVNNAGIVVVSPFFPRYFEMLNLTENGQFKDEEAASRAVHLLQYITTGQTETAEPFLVFNKVLCGLPMTTPVPKGIELTEQEKTVTEQMMSAILAHWKGLGTTTLDGLRGGFLVRNGKLEWNQDGYWNLDVEKKSYDILMNSLPWSISIIQHTWMEKRIQVTWY